MALQVFIRLGHARQRDQDDREPIRQLRRGQNDSRFGLHEMAMLTHILSFVDGMVLEKIRNGSGLKSDQNGN